jgi:hypothetical protein
MGSIVCSHYNKLVRYETIKLRRMENGNGFQRNNANEICVIY